MVLQMFGSKEASIPELIAKKKYAQAIDLLKGEMKRRPQDEQIQIQLADILILDGKKSAAAQLYRSVADGLAERGFAAKAIALLKKVQRVEGASVELEQKLASLIKQSQPADAAPARRPMPPPPPPPPPPMFVPEPEAPSLAIEPEPYEPLPENRADETPPASPRIESFAAPEIPPVKAAVERQAPPRPQPPPPPPPPPPIVAEEEEIPVEMVVEEEPADEEPAAAEEPAESDRPLSTPLFADFSDEELVAVMRGLELHSFEPGDVIVTQGEPGDSLFILASGVVKAFVRKDDGTSMLVRTMYEGDFFGEIALLTGKERTATITAATNCDLLELDRATLDDISSRQPAVRKVVMDFYNQRAHVAAASMVQTIDIEEEEPPGETTQVREEKPKEAPKAAAPAPTMKLTVRETPKPDAAAKKVTVEMQEDLNAIVLYDTAISATRASNWAEAFPLWKEYVEIKPDDKQAASVFGVVCAKLEKWDDAIGAFRNAARLNPNDSSIYYNLGVACAKLGRWADAVKAYEKAVQLKPDYEKAKQSLANARKNL